MRWDAPHARAFVEMSAAEVVAAAAVEEQHFVADDSLPVIVRTNSSVAVVVVDEETIACSGVVAIVDAVEKPAFGDPLVTLEYVQSAYKADNPAGHRPDSGVA